MIELDLTRYEKNVLKNLDKKNIDKIISFLSSKHCNYIEELLDDYLDLFTINYKDFIKRFEKLNIKYNNNLIDEISHDMNILDEFYTID